MHLAQNVNLPTVYKAAMLTQAAKPLVIVERPIQPLNQGEVWVKIHASPINPSDLAMLAGTYPHKKVYPFVPGLEASGTVVASGGGLFANFLLGKRVACSAPESADGTWAEYMRAPAGNCIPVLKKLNHEEAACAIVNPFTALALIERVQRSGSKSFLNSPAGGALGNMIANLAEAKGLKAINIMRNQLQIDQQKRSTAHVYLNASGADFLPQLKEAIAVHQPKIMLDAVGGNFTDHFISTALPDATLVCYGAITQELLAINPAPIIRFGKKIEGFHLAHYLGHQPMLKKLKLAIQAQKGIASGLLATRVYSRFSLVEINEALSAYQQRMSQGKYLLMFSN